MGVFTFFIIKNPIMNTLCIELMAQIMFAA